MPLDRVSHRYSKATPPVETPPVNPFLAPTSVPSSILRESSVSPDTPTPALVNGVKKNGVNGTASLGLNDNYTDAHLLNQAEQQLCATLRIKPKPYMCIKERVLTEAVKQGGNLKEKTTKDLCRVSNLVIFFLLRANLPPRLMFIRLQKFTNSSKSPVGLEGHNIITSLSLV